MKSTTKKIERIAFFGDATINQDDPVYQTAFDSAVLLAQNKFIIINGGGPGIMAAATIGAKEAGGKVEIVVMSAKDAPKQNYEGVDQNNFSLADKVYTTHTYQDRMNKLVDLADAYVIFKGGTGTLSEVGLVWEMAKFEYGHHEPLIFVGQEWQEVIATLSKNMNYESVEKRVVTVVNTPKEVLKTIKNITL